MRTFKAVIIIALCLSLCGCASLIARPSKVVLLPEERIFTVPGGQNISVMLDKKPMSMTFPEDMKLVSSTVLVRQEERLNNALLDKVKANQATAKKAGLIGSILACIAAALGIFFKAKKWLPNFKANVEIK